MKQFKLFFDMDEVLYDLSEVVRTHVNHDFNKNYPNGFNKNYWWQDYGIPKSYFEKLLQQKGVFYEGEPIKDSIETINKLHDEGYEIHILTQPQINNTCFYEKAMFIKKYLPWFNLDTNFHCSGNKGLMAYSKYTKNILIDDNINHLNNWKDNGGIPICFSMGWNEDWSCDYRANNFDEVYKLIHDDLIYYSQRR